MRFADCEHCPQLSIDCNGANPLTKDQEDLITTLDRMRRVKRFTYDMIAEHTDLAKSTVAGVFQHPNADIKVDTLRRIYKFVMCGPGGDWVQTECAKLKDTERAQLVATIDHLRAEAERREKAVAYLKAQVASEQSARRRKDVVIVVAFGLLVLALAVIVTALVIDRMDSSKGFFWLGNIFASLG